MCGGKVVAKCDVLTIREESIGKYNLKGVFSPYEKKYWEVGVDTLMGFTDVSQYERRYWEVGVE